MTKTFEEWEKIFNKYDLWYQKVQTYDDLIQDPMAQPGFTEIPRSNLDIDEGVEKIVTVSPPVDFDGEKHRTRDVILYGTGLPGLANPTPAGGQCDSGGQNHRPTS